MLMSTLALILFAGSLAAPITVAVGLWNLARRARSGWLFHLLFAPSAIACEWIMVQLLGAAAGDNGDGPPGEGFLYALGFLTLFITVMIYYAWLTVKTLIRSLRGRALVQ
jgi:hypothetical protein